ncbi:MAG: DMT family transporter [Rhodobacteraceae bacterium]|nr:DMT family transporter [Paracoccaceae bacterium]
MALKSGLLILLGLLWSVRLSAIKAAGLAGIPVHVVVAVAALGIAAFFSMRAASLRDWPPLSREVVVFYALSGTLGFLAPFVLESAVAPNLPVFLFVVIIATMPLVTLLLSILVGSEQLRTLPILAVALGFAGAVAIVWDTTRVGTAEQSSALWVTAAFGVPLLYAINTVFVATRWPASTGPVHVAHAQALIVATAAVLGSVASGLIADWHLVGLDLPAMGLIVVGEGLALLVYLRIAREYGATYVSFANYVSMIFAAILGAVWFDDQLTRLTFGATVLIVAAVALYQRFGQNKQMKCEATAME